MRDDKIRAVVTGDPRSGTSMMMQCCNLAGLLIAGNIHIRGSKRNNIAKGGLKGKFNKKTSLKKPKLRGVSKKSKNIMAIKRAQRSRELNPKGFYEIPGVVMNGIRKINDLVRGRVLKIIASGIGPRELPNGKRLGTPSEIVDKYILCLRHPRNVIESQEKLVGNILVGDEDNPAEWDFPNSPPSANAYLLRMGSLLIWLNDQDQDLRDRFLPVQFDDMLFKPEQTLTEVFNHIDHHPTEHQMKLAVSNISVDLRRSINMDDWPEGLEEAGHIAELIYNSLSSMNKDEMAFATILLKEFSEKSMFESNAWVDDEDTWATISSVSKREILKGNKLADSLRNSLAKYRRSKLICDQCEFYSRDPEKTYTIDRPADLGPLVRPMVYCNRDKEYKTVEECKPCWQRGSLVGGELKEAQRLVQLGIK